MSFLENDFFLLAVTFGIFFFAKLLQKKTGPLSGAAVQRGAAE